MQAKQKKFLSVGLGILALALLILYMGGSFATGLIGPESKVSKPITFYQPAETAKAVKTDMKQWYQAVGTVKALNQVNVEAQITAKIIQVKVRAGDLVERGDLLVTLDDDRQQSQLEQSKEHLQMAKSRLAQSREGINAAQAAYNQAESQYNRVKKYYQAEAATKKDLEEAESSFLQAKARLQQARDGLSQAKAGLRQAQKMLEESRIALNYTEIHSPLSGQVGDRLADPGDLARPGKPLLMLQSTKELRLEALVREGLIRKMEVGQEFDVQISSADLKVKGMVQEIVPTADPRSRTFAVKVSIPDLPGIYPGMFGRLLVPVGKKRAVLVSKQAVRSIGQLEMVKARIDGSWKSVLVTTGEEDQDLVEVLSGLSGGETVALLRGLNG
jgi:RND family efflux transporter MFP subunit